MDLFMMNCELLATCSALGYLEGDIYHREPDCLESVKDLIRYLRHEDETRDVRQQLGAAQILQNDLLPILVQYPQDKVLFDAVIRLMVNLTQPALLCFGKVPPDATSRHHFLQVLSYLQAYKEAFASEKVFVVLSEKLYDLLQLDWEQRQEEDTLLIERILLLVRNVLHVPPDPTEEQGVDGDASVHDRVLWALHISGMDDLLKFLASAQTEQQWALHVLEIISLMFRDQSPEELAVLGQGQGAAEHGEDTRELQTLRQRELAEKRARALQRPSRHSRFGGSYVLQGLKAIGDRDVVFHKGLHNLKSYSHDLGKELRRVPRRRQAAPETEIPRRSARNVRLFLRCFCQDFLENCYNRLMLQVKVVKQLVRLGLAASARDFPRERKGTRLVLWTEEQEEELRRLFEEFQGSEVLGTIMKHLTARRSRARVVEKLLGLGLVSERKELYKKRRRKGHGAGPVWGAWGGVLDCAQGVTPQDSSAEDGDSEEEEEEDEADHWVPEEGAGQGLAHHLHQEGLSGPLQWLENSLRRTAGDREEDGVSHPVPLVPLSEENEDAME
ncbi:Protein timeless, partial [Calypte anna]